MAAFFTTHRPVIPKRFELQSQTQIQRSHVPTVKLPTYYVTSVITAQQPNPSLQCLARHGPVLLGQLNK